MIGWYTFLYMGHFVNTLATSTTTEVIVWLQYSTQCPMMFIEIVSTAVECRDQYMN